MEDDIQRDARKGKAKVEQDDKPTPETYSNLGDGVVYLKTFGPRREHVVVKGDSPELIKKIQFRFRNKEYHRIVESMSRIHNQSKATIRILFDKPATYHNHLYFEILGTANELKIAEFLIEDAISEVYTIYVPKALMPTVISHHAITILENQVAPLFGIDGIGLLKLEAESNTWIEVEERPREGIQGKISYRKVKIYGEGSNVRNAILRINDQLAEESIKLKNEVVVQDIGSGEKSGKMEDRNKKDVEKDGIGITEGDDDSRIKEG